MLRADVTKSRRESSKDTAGETRRTHFPCASLLLLFLLLLCSPFSDGAQNGGGSLPELPQIVPEDFPPATLREKVRAAYAAVLAQPLDASANGELGMVLEAYRPNDQKAEACFRRAHRLDPQSFRWAYYLATVLAARANQEDAMAALKEGLNLDPGYLPAQLKMGQYLRKEGRTEEAVKIYEDIVRRFPESAEAHYELGQAYESARNLEKAATSFQKACDLFPFFGAAHYSLARAYQRVGKTGAVQDELARYEQNKYDVPGVGDKLQADLDAIYMDPQQLLGLAIELGNRQRWEEAIVKHELVLKFDPDMVRAHINLISLYGHVGDFEKAQQHYLEAVRLDPTQAQSYYDYGVLLTIQNKSDEAQSAFRKALAANPRHAEAHNNLGDLLQREGKLEEAMAEFRMAVEYKPDFPQAHFNLGRLLGNQGEYRTAITELLKSVDSPNEDVRATYLYAIGVAYARVGDRSNAVHYLHLAREQAQSTHQANLLGDIDRDLQTLGN